MAKWSSNYLARRDDGDAMGFNVWAIRPSLPIDCTSIYEYIYICLCDTAIACASDASRGSPAGESRLTEHDTKKSVAHYLFLYLMCQDYLGRNVRL